MTTINDLGNQNLKELSRTYNLEVNTPFIGNSSILLRREKLLLINNSIATQTQLEPIIKNYSNSAKDMITVFDPLAGTNVTLSIVALVAAIQQIGH